MRNEQNKRIQLFKNNILNDPDQDQDWDQEHRQITQPLTCPGLVNIKNLVSRCGGVSVMAIVSSTKIF